MDELVLMSEAELIRGLDNRSLQILAIAISCKEMSLIDIATELFPELTREYLAKLIAKNKLNKLISFIHDSPSIAAQLLAIKLMPLSVLSLHKLITTEETRDNVKATSAKELIRLAESSISKLGSVRTNPKESLAKLIANED